MIMRSHLILGLVVSSVFLAACTKDRASVQEQAEPTAASEATPKTRVPESVRRSMDEMLGAYENARALLAADQAEGLHAAAEQMASAAKAAMAEAPGSLKPHLASLDGAARRMKDQPEANLAEMRKAFGEVSRPVVALLGAEPALAKEKHVFECGMADGYPKWVQNSSSISNPYMGQRMPGCGSASDWQ